MRVQIFKPLLLIQIKIVVHHFFFLLSPRRCNYNVEKIYSNFFFYVFKTFYDVWNDMTYFICY